ncbi:MAG: helix-hairpin-helix domain-containing protein [Sandaracinus sp.]|nr:helix-hairpin-helix domain-containing protein [Sandaracinus sp.]MCB9617967.1 helix-hairpin-helix domain-containing protein [Sandaracinus sp.]MCB9622488.1 helix-hairpin-helix domain-containing protein [Sandaracinus sp.]
MEASTLSLLDAATHALGLHHAVHPWGLRLVRGKVREEVRAPLPVVFDRVLAPSAPSPYDLPPELVLDAFAADERDAIARQIDASYDTLHVLDLETPETDPEAVVRVRLGMPLITRAHVLLRVRATNLFRDTRDRPQDVVFDAHAWLDPEGRVLDTLTPAQAALAPTWPRWVPGRSPGLPARVSLNTASEEALSHLPALTRPMVRDVCAGRPFVSEADLLKRTGIGPRTWEQLRDWVAL